MAEVGRKFGKCPNRKMAKLLIGGSKRRFADVRRNADKYKRKYKYSKSGSDLGMASRCAHSYSNMLSTHPKTKRNSRIWKNVADDLSDQYKKRACHRNMKTKRTACKCSPHKKYSKKTKKCIKER